MSRRHLARGLALGALTLLSAIAAPSLRRAFAAGPIAAATKNPADDIFERAGLNGILSHDVFVTAYERMARQGEPTRTLAIADMSQPSTAQRFVLVDLEDPHVLLQTWVAHGSGSGELMAQRFSNRAESHQTSLGLYRVGSQIRSPKHGAALLLEGLDPGLNDLARARQVIIHGADYVSERFIAQTGRLGRSWGCPALPREHMATVIAALSDGGYLFVYGA